MKTINKSVFNKDGTYHYEIYILKEEVLELIDEQIWALKQKCYVLSKAECKFNESLWLELEELKKRING